VKVPEKIASNGLEYEKQFCSHNYNYMKPLLTKEQRDQYNFMVNQSGVDESR